MSSITAYQRGEMIGRAKEREEITLELKSLLFGMIDESNLEPILSPIVDALLKKTGWLAHIGQVIKEISPQQYMVKAFKAIEMLRSYVLWRNAISHAMKRSDNTPPSEYKYYMNLYDEQMSYTIATCIAILRHMGTVIPSKKIQSMVIPRFERERGKSPSSIPIEGTGVTYEKTVYPNRPLEELENEYP